jgi:polysaccharide biosynthesis protein PslH
MAKVLGLVTFKIYPPQMGGQKGVALFYDHLAAHHDIYLAVSKDNEVSQSKVLPVLFPNKKILQNIRKLPALKKYIRDQKIDVIISEHSYPAWMAWWLSKRCGIPFIIHSHNIEAYRFKKMNRSWWKQYLVYEKWIHAKADHNFFISEHDRRLAQQLFDLDPSKCSVVTYGVDQPGQFSRSPENEIWLLFNGSLDYQPNQEAVALMVNKLNPLLKARINNYKIIITGKGAPAPLVDLMSRVPEIEYRGFVQDMDALYRQTTVFINPVLNDTGIKTKVVEAIGNHCTVVSTASGATGMETDLCGDKLVVIPDDDWNRFASAIADLSSKPFQATGEKYYQTYAWTAIASKAGTVIQNLVEKHRQTREG